MIAIKWIMMIFFWPDHPILSAPQIMTFTFSLLPANVLFDKDIISLETTEWESHFLLKPSGLLSGNLP